jgi:hypothetical protein
VTALLVEVGVVVAPAALTARMLVPLALRTCPAALSAGPAIGPGGGDDEDDHAGEEVTVGRLPLQGVPPVAGLAGGEDVVRAEPVDVAVAD